MSAWTDLKALRDAGHRPAGALWVFSSREHWRLRAALIEVGSMVIDHDAQERIPSELLGGLDVLIMPASCAHVCELGREIREGKYPPKRCQVWCECSGALLPYAHGDCKR